MANPRRRCTICDTPIPAHKPGNATVCGPDCAKERHRRGAAEYRRNNPEKRAATVRNYRARKRPGEIKARRHGLDYDTYLALLDAAGHACTICGAVDNLRIDHDHDCCPDHSCGNCVRGIICHLCNLNLGAWHDNLDMLAAAIRYLLGERGTRLVDGGLDALRAVLK